MRWGQKKLFNIILSAFINFKLEVLKQEKNCLIKKLDFLVDYITKHSYSRFIEKKMKVFILYKILGLVILMNNQKVYRNDLLVILNKVSSKD